MSFIEEHRGEYPARRLCRLLEVSEAGWRKWRKRRDNPPGRERENRQLSGRIVAIHKESRRTYGSPRIVLQLRAEGSRCGRKRVARLMKQEGICGGGRKRWRARTTDSKHGHPVAPNLLKGACAGRPNQIWQADITYVRTEQGWLYLAAILDSFTRKIVGWNMQEHLRTELALGALAMALDQQRPGPGLVHHSDRGTQYASADYRQALERAGARPSMSRKGNCYDNATMESFFGTLKTEQVQNRIYPDSRTARMDIFSYIEGFYNTRRIHTSLGGRSPDQAGREALQITPGGNPDGKLLTPSPPTSSLADSR